MADNVLSIGAVVDTQQFLAGMGDLQNGVKAAVDNIVVSTNAMSIKTTNDLQKLSAEVRSNVATVTDASIRVAEATRRRIQASADVRHALRLTHNAEISEAESTRILAASQEELRAATLQVAETTAAAAGTTVESTEVMAGGFMAMSAKARESLGMVQEKLVATAEKAELSADGIASGFGGLGKLLGVGIAGEFLGHMIDNLAEANVKIGDMSTNTNIAIQTLAGLKAVADGLKLQFQPISRGLMRMSSSQVEAASATSATSLQVKAFTMLLGKSKETMDALKNSSPEEMFFRLSKAVHDNTNATQVNFAMREIFGRGAQGLTTIFKEQGNALESLTAHQGALSGYTEQSYESSQKLLRSERDIALAIHSAMIPAINDLADAIEPIRIGIDRVSIGLETWVGTPLNAVLTILDSLGDLAKAFKFLGLEISDAVHGNFKQMVADAKASDDAIRSIWTANKEGWASQKKHSEDAALDMYTLQAEKGGGLLHPKAAPTGPAPSKQMVVWDAQFAALTEGHKTSIKEEIKFWKEKEAITKKGSDDYNAIAFKINQLDPYAREPKTKKPHKEHTAHADHAQQEFDRSIEKHGKVETIGGRISKQLMKAEADSRDAFAEMELATAGFSRKTADDVNHTGKAWKDYNNELQRQLVTAAEQRAAMAEDSVRMMRSMGSITQLGEAQRMAALHTEEYTARLKALREELARLEAQAQKDALGNYSDPQQATKILQVKGQIATTEGQQQMTGMKDKASEAEGFAAPWKSAFGQINSSWLQMQDAMIMGNHNLGLMFRNTGAALVASMAQSFEQMVIKHAEAELLMVAQHRMAAQMNLATDAQTHGIKEAMALKEFALFLAHEVQKIFIHTSTAAAKISIAATADTTKLALTVASNVAQAQSAAGLAAAQAAASAAVGGPASAAAAGAIMLATIEPFVAMAGFAHGGIVGGHPGMAVPILAHAGERVLTPHQTMHFERMVSGEAGPGGGDHSVHMHMENHFHGNTDAQFREAAGRNAEHMFNTVKDHVRRAGWR